MTEFRVNWYWIVKGDSPIFQLDKSARVLVMDGAGTKVVEKTDKLTVPLFELEASVGGPLRVRDLILSQLKTMLRASAINKIHPGNLYGVLRNISQRGGPSLGGGGVFRDVGVLGLFYSPTRLAPLSGVKSSFMTPAMIKSLDVPESVEGEEPPPPEKEIYRPSRFQREPVI